MASRYRRVVLQRVVLRCCHLQEVVQGKSLAQMVSSGMRADESQVTRIAQDLLAILKYLAGLRPPVIHRWAPGFHQVMAQVGVQLLCSAQDLLAGSTHNWQSYGHPSCIVVRRRPPGVGRGSIL
jgi:hypothetical protein